jgi:hypothetical protein
MAEMMSEAEVMAMDEENQGPDDSLFLAAIANAERSSYGADGDTMLDAERARSIDDYLGREYGNEVEGRSHVISRDVYDTIEWIKPSLLRIFTAGDEVAKFDPIGPEDEAQADQESDYINHVIQDKNPWFTIAYEWFTDALLTKNAYAMAYWDTSQQIETERYKGLTEEQLTLIVQDEAIEIVEHTAVQDGQPQPDPATGQMMPPTLLHDVVIKRTKEYSGVKICVLPPERCLVSEAVTGMSVRDADFFEFWDMVTISKLRAMGFDIPDDIRDDTGDNDTEEDIARDQFNEESFKRDAETNDPSMRKVCLRILWIRYDYDGDGLAELRHVMKVGDTILYNEESSGVQVASIVPTPLPHRHPGLSVRDMVHDLQLIKTTIMRQMLDNLYLANNGRYGVSDKVNLDDMLTSRPGGVVRVQGGIPGQEIFPLVHPSIATQGIETLAYIDQVREGRTGTSRALNNVDPNVLQKGISGVAVAQLYSAAGQRLEMIARVFAEGVKELFLIVHELCIKHGHQQSVVRLRNQWIPVNPSEWKRRSDMRISVGLGTGNKEQLMANLSTILAAQKEAIQIGITTPKQIYNALAELTKAAGFASPSKFWTEPPDGPPPPQQDPNQAVIEGQIQIETVKQQAETQRTQMEIESKERIAQAEIQAKMQMEAMRAKPADLSGYQVKQKEGGEVVIAKRETLEAEDMNQQQMQQLNELVQALVQVAQTMQQSAQVMMMPKRKIPTRDMNGRITHVDEVPIQ